MPVMEWPHGTRLRPPVERAETELGVPVALASGRDLRMPPWVAAVYDWGVRPNVELPFVPAIGVQVPRFGLPKPQIAALEAIVQTARERAPGLMRRLESWGDFVVRPFRSRLDERTLHAKMQGLPVGRNPMIEVLFSKDYLVPEMRDEAARVLLHELSHLETERIPHQVLQSLADQAIPRLPNRELASMWENMVSNDPVYRGTGLLEELVTLMFENEAMPRTWTVPPVQSGAHRLLDRLAPAWDELVRRLGPRGSGP